MAVMTENIEETETEEERLKREDVERRLRSTLLNPDRVCKHFRSD